MINGDSIFWVEVDKIKPNPYQPRRFFDETKLRDLSDSIRQYGVLQPLVVTRREVEIPSGGLAVEYELIAGERRLRASKMAGVFQVPVVIRVDPEAESDRLKLELAIIENIQREDLNPVERARAFSKLSEEFKFTHQEIGKKIAKSREYVTNSLRLLTLPEEVLVALSEGRITEGHTRPLLMLTDRPEERSTLFKDITLKKLTVREAERIARHIAQDRARKTTGDMNPKVLELEKRFMENLGTRVQIELKDLGGRITIDFYSDDDLNNLLNRVSKDLSAKAGETGEVETAKVAEEIVEQVLEQEILNDVPQNEPPSDDDLYSIKNFTV